MYKYAASNYKVKYHLICTRFSIGFTKTVMRITNFNSQKHIYNKLYKHQKQINQSYHQKHIRN